MPRRSTVTNALSVLGTKGFVLALALLSVIIQARALGPEGRGLLAALIVLPQIVTPLAACGVTHALTFYVGRKTVERGTLYGSATVFLGLSTALAVGLVAYIQFHSPYGFTTSMVALAVLLIPLGITSDALIGVALGSQFIEAFNRISWVQKLLMITFLGSFWTVGLLNVLTAAMSLVAATFASLLLALFTLIRAGSTRPRHWTANRKVANQVFGKGLLIAATTCALAVLYKSDIYIVGWLGTEEQTGLYAVAVQIGSMLWEFPVALSMIVLSRTANRSATTEESTRAFASAVRLSFWGMVGLGGVAFFLAPVVLPPMLGDEFAQSAQLFQLLVPGITAMTIFQLLSMRLTGEGRVLDQLLILAPFAVAKIGLSICIVPLFGIIGAALLSSTVYVAVAACMAFHFSRRASIPLSTLILLRKIDLERLLERVEATHRKVRRFQ